MVTKQEAKVKVLQQEELQELREVLSFQVFPGSEQEFRAILSLLIL